MRRGNSVTIRQTPAHFGVDGTGSPTYGRDSREYTICSVDKSLLDETSLAHVSRIIAEAMSQDMAK